MQASLPEVPSEASTDQSGRAEQESRGSNRAKAGETMVRSVRAASYVYRSMRSEIPPSSEPVARVRNSPKQLSFSPLPCGFSPTRSTI